VKSLPQTTAEMATEVVLVQFAGVLLLCNLGCPSLITIAFGALPACVSWRCCWSTCTASVPSRDVLNLNGVTGRVRLLPWRPYVHVDRVDCRASGGTGVGWVCPALAVMRWFGGHGCTARLEASEAPRAAAFSSGEQLREKKQRHTRDKDGPVDKFAVPLATSHEVGWGAKTAAPFTTKAFPRVAYEETKYLDELLKSGVTF
jgi:hypothetical protein